MLCPGRGRLHLIGPLLGAVALVGEHLDLAGPLPIVQPVLPLVGLVGVAWALIALMHRRWVSALVCLALAAALVQPLLPHARQRPEQPGDLRVLALNTELGSADAAQVVAAVRRTGPDALVLTEATPALWQRLRGAGLGALLPHASGQVEPGSRGTLVATRAPHDCVEGVAVCGQVTRSPGSGSGPAQAPTVRLAGGVVLTGVHPFAPLPGTTGRWRSELGALVGWADRHTGPWVMAGDLNAGRVHPVFRRLTRDTTVLPDDHHLWLRTWPHEGRPYPPFVALDHVIARDLEPVASGTVAIPGTDHLAVWAVLRRAR
ncbi:endonuclease/exonuclease/phosphatase family protein [Arsenicicoccus dermatophilus]|uniref:endonuclease/exonuclease/phosphatase family protein n=1 Tax=Arsenicicoccus dermatophilus TaxID=1076331 RepID=UPI001F4D0EA7|nr:endonuclease/exonuclease/phosphatase family protein [Arsenicicoccus dermatophilus]MCH8612811.1 endonuclease/exonuclease/phosphatase family protein [Arsenicicoccus dermatophilus]